MPYPQCLEIKYSAETFSELRTRQTEIAVEDGDTIGGADRSQVLAAMDLGAPDGHEQCQIKSSASELSAEDRAEMQQQAASIKKNIAKCHAVWDRSKRDLQMRLASSMSCERTRGSVVEQELSQAVEAGTTVDHNLMNLEAQIKAAGDIMSLAEMSQAKSWCDELYKHRQRGMSRSSMLQSWIDAG